MKGNHSALECRHRLNTSFQPVFPSYTMGPSQMPAFTPRAFSAQTPFPAVSTSMQSTSAPWYVDSAATSHLTNDLNNLHFYQPYQGNDQVMIGDGNTLPIHNSGTGILSSPSFQFRLTNLLHVPQISSN